MARLKAMVVLVLLLVIIPSILAVGCNKAESGGELPAPSPDISVEEAKAILDQAVAYAKGHDLDALCGMGGVRYRSASAIGETPGSGTESRQRLPMLWTPI